MTTGIILVYRSYNPKWIKVAPGHYVQMNFRKTALYIGIVFVILSIAGFWGLMWKENQSFYTGKE